MHRERLPWPTQRGSVKLRPGESDAKVALGTTVRARRAALHLSQEELGERAGLHRTYVGGIERGERNPSYVNLLRIAQALRTPLSGLIEKAEHTHGPG